MSDKVFPVSIGFDVDGESLWTSRDATHVNRPVQLSMGSYGLNEGVPRILRLLDKYNIKATFFIVGSIAEKYPEKIKAIADAGHNLGNHSWSHVHPHKYEKKEDEMAELLKTSEIVKKLTGKQLIGYRSPAWELSSHTIEILEEMGMKWSSTTMGSDSMTRLSAFGHTSEIVDIPVHWRWDDAAFWLYSVNLPGKCMQPHTAVRDYWIDEFDALYEEFFMDDTGERKNQCFTLTCHPQITGAPAKLKVLEDVIKHILEKPNVEFLTCEQMYERYLKLNS